MADENEVQNVSEEEAGEDVPSNFFDDFEKDDFLEGLEVIDSTHDVNGRENSSQNDRSPHRTRRSTSSSRLDDYIKPGSRRDPEKTNAAIRRDKAVKVKEQLAKHFESQDDLCPPGTELDDYFDDARPLKSVKNDFTDCKIDEHKARRSGSKKHDTRESPRWRSPSPYPPWRANRGHYRGSYHGAHDTPQYHPRHTNRYPRYSPHRNPKFVLRQGPSYTSRHSPRQSPWHSPMRSSRRSPRRSPRNSPARGSRYSPGRSSRHTPPRNSRYSPRHSPRRRSPKHSPHRSPKHNSQHSPQFSLQQEARSNSRSSIKHSVSNRSPHWSPKRSPRVSSNSDYNNKQPSRRRYSSPRIVEFNQKYNPENQPTSANFAYTFNEIYSNYPTQPGPPEMAYPQPDLTGMNMLQPVPMAIDPVPQSGMPQLNPHINYMIPEQVSMVPPPQMLAPTTPQVTQTSQFQHLEDENTTKHDALAQLVADGKLSMEDYLKLTPSIKGGTNLLDEKTKITVLTRCNQAVNKLNMLLNPNRFCFEDKKCITEMLSLPQKYASPLKRQAHVEFEFTKPESQNKIKNKQLINSIVATIGLEKAMLRTKITRDMKSVGIQTTKPYCDMCEIRESTKKCSVGVGTDPLYLMNSVHTQVVEKDLLNSKAIFNPSGSVADGAPISIAHLTPAQLVSQLAARAKTFQQAESPSASDQLYPRWNPPNSYEGRGGAHNYNPSHHYRY